MELQTFIDENRDEINSAIKRLCPNCQIVDDGDREDWILNDEGLYNWARAEGVNPL